MMSLNKNITNIYIYLLDTVKKPTVKVKVNFALQQTTKAQSGSKYISILPSTSALERRWVANATSQPLYPLERADSNFIEGWVGPRAGLDGCRKSRPQRD